MHWQSPPRWPRGLVTAATQRSFIRGLTQEMLTHCYAHQSGDCDANYLFTSKEFQEPPWPCTRFSVPENLLLSWEVFRRGGLCPLGLGRSSSARERTTAAAHALLEAPPGPAPLISTWELQSQPYHCPHLPTPNPTPAHICPHLPTPVLPLPIPAHSYPTPAHACPHLPTLNLHLPTLILHPPTPAHTCPHLSTPAHTYPTPAHTCPHLSTPVHTCPTSVHTCPHLSYPCPHLPMLILPRPHLSTPILPLPTPAHTCPTPVHTCPYLSYPCPHLPYATPYLPDLPGPAGRGVSTGSRRSQADQCRGGSGVRGCTGSDSRVGCGGWGWVLGTAQDLYLGDTKLG